MCWVSGKKQAKRKTLGPHPGSLCSQIVFFFFYIKTTVSPYGSSLPMSTNNTFCLTVSCARRQVEDWSRLPSQKCPSFYQLVSSATITVTCADEASLQAQPPDPQTRGPVTLSPPTTTTTEGFSLQDEKINGFHVVLVLQ